MHIKQVSEPIRVWFQQGFSFAGADTEMRAQSSVVLTLATWYSLLLLSAKCETPRCARWVVIWRRRIMHPERSAIQITMSQLICFVALSLLMTHLQYGAAIDRRQLFPFGATQGDMRMDVGDDISSSEVQLRTRIVFYDDSFSSLYVSVNSSASWCCLSVCHSASEPAQMFMSWCHADFRVGMTPLSLLLAKLLLLPVIDRHIGYSAKDGVSEDPIIRSWSGVDTATFAVL